MAEHASRYRTFGLAMAKEGIAVYASDLRGHGKTAGHIDNVGYFADRDGWNLVLGDIYDFTRIIKKDHPGIPFFLFGHSMGSLLVRNYCFIYGKEIDGIILSGSSGDPGLLKYLGILVSRLEILFKGKRAKSPFLNKLTLGAYNKDFSPARTDFDWLSRDNKIVDEYVSDPFCGGVFSAGFFLDLSHGAFAVNDPKNINRTPGDLPIFLLAGEFDAVSNMAKDIEKICGQYRRAQVKDISYKIYPGARHELFNETNKEEVYRDIINWIDQHI
jgi:alpha-beta hydrolase superfamily lysophospholipase